MASHEAKGATAPSSNDSLTAAAADGPRPLSRSGAASPDEADSLGRKDLSDSEGHAGAPVGESQAEYRAHLASQPVGVSKIEALYRVFGNSKAAVWTLYAAISAIVIVFCFDGSTTSSYQTVAASEYAKHAELLGVIDTAESIIIAVSKPFISKVADISSRQMAYLGILVLYVFGYLLVAATTTAGGFAAGRIISATGQAGLDLVTDIIVADISPLQWRGFMTALTSSPYLFLAWVGPQVSGPLVDRREWRWGFGMFCILAPVCVMPAIIVMWRAEKVAKANGELAFTASPYERRLVAEQGTTANKESYFTLVKKFCIELDIIGLVLLAAAWCLIFLPFSLRGDRPRGWRDPGLIAMIAVGGTLLILFFVYEWLWASKPIMTRRIFKNRTFQLAVTLDIFYFMSGSLRSLYYSSYVYVIKDWTSVEWGYFNNISTFCLTLFGISAGLVLRYTHRYKMLQIGGNCIRLIAMGLTFWARGPNASTGALVSAQVLNSLGGACSVVGTRVASQASVPHEDLAQVIALLSLWTRLGGSVGSAISAAIWQGTIRGYMREEGVPEARIQPIYGRFISARSLPIDDPIRQAVSRAADRAMYPITLAALCISVLPLLASLFMKNYYLGARHNAVEQRGVDGRIVEGEGDLSDPTADPHAPRTATPVVPQGFWAKLKYYLI